MKIVLLVLKKVVHLHPLSNKNINLTCQI